MRKRLIVLLGYFVAFYYLVHIVYDMPDLIHGNSRFTLFPGSARALASRLGDLLYYSSLAVIPYLTFFYCWPQKRIGQGILILLTGLPIAFLLPYWAGLVGAPLLRSIRLRTFFLEHIAYALMAFIFGTIFYFIRYARYKELEQKELELQNRQSELSFLRSQLNPHFLFNSLNNIYSLVYQGSGQALTAIAGLSDLLRYMLYDAAEKVTLDKEMDYIRKYIGLQQLRFEHPLQTNIEVQGDLNKIVIPPLLLIPFVENAFKHGDNSENGGGITIVLHSDPKKIYFHCSNRKGAQQKDPGGGIGLENVKRRLALLYPDRHTLLIGNSPAHFSITLELTI